MKKSTIILFVFLILCLHICFSISDEYLYINEKNNVTVSCFSGGLPCDNTYSCNLTVLNPDSNKLIDNSDMTYGNPFYYELSEFNVTQSGDYKIIAYCYNTTDAKSSTYFMRANYMGKDYTGFNNLGIYIILILAIVGSLYASFQLKNFHIIPKIVLFFNGLINLLGALFISYLDLTNADISFAILTMFTVNGLVLMVVFYLVAKRVLFDAAKMKEADEGEDYV
jgi:hypothetical protein